MLTIRSTVQTALAASALALMSFAAPAQAHGTYGPGASQGAFVNVQFGAPPPPRYEAMPAPRRGYIWAPGYWEPRGHRHVWRAGHWVQARPGYVYRPPTWSHHGGRWDYRGSRWDRNPHRR